MATATNVFSSMGTSFKQNSTPIAHLSSIKGLDLKASTIDTTSLDADNGYKTFVLGEKDGGQVQIQGFFNSADHSALYNSFQSGSVDSYDIVFPDIVTVGTGTGSTWAFSGVVMEFKTDVKVGSAVGFEATIKVSGAPTFTQAT